MTTNHIIKQTNGSFSGLVDKNHSLQRKNRIAYVGLVLLTAFSTLISWDDIKTRVDLNKARKDKEISTKRAADFKRLTTDLIFKNVHLKRYARNAQKLANSMTFYPDMPDFVDSLPEKDQEKAQEELKIKNAQKEDEHNKALKILGVDKKLLHLVQQGIQEK